MRSQAAGNRGGAMDGPRPPSGNMKQLGRAFSYLSDYRGTAAVAIVALLISIFAQLLVPQMIQNILDAVTQGLTLQQSGTPAAQQTAMDVAIQALVWSIIWI